MMTTLRVNTAGSGLHSGIHMSRRRAAAGPAIPVRCRSARRRRRLRRRLRCRHACRRRRPCPPSTASSCRPCGRRSPCRTPRRRAERHAHVRVPGIRSHGLLARRLADRIVSGGRESVGRRRKVRRPHDLHGAVRVAADDAHVLARAGRAGHVDVVVVRASAMFRTKLVGYSQARRVVRPAHSLGIDRHGCRGATPGSRAKASGWTRKTRTCGISSARR